MEAWAEAARWLNRAGMVLGFASFWFAAPELIGEERLKKWEERLEAGVARFPLAAKGCVFVVTACVVGPFLSYFAAILLAAFLRPQEAAAVGPGKYDYVKEWHVVVGAVATFLGIGGGVQAFGGDVEHWARERVAVPLLRRLADDDAVRRRWLVAGIWMFTLGFLLQFVASFA